MSETTNANTTCVRLEKNLATRIKILAALANTNALTLTCELLEPAVSAREIDAKRRYSSGVLDKARRASPK